MPRMLLLILPILELLDKFLAETLVRDYHVNHHGVEHHNLEYEGEPRRLNDDRDEHCNDARVEREHVGVLHQGQTLLAEVVAELLRNGTAIVTEARLEFTVQALQSRRERFLLTGVVAIEGQGELFHEILAPSELVVVLGNLLRTVEFAAFLAFEEEEVELAVVVGTRRLLGVAQTCKDRHRPYHPVVTVAITKIIKEPAIAIEEISIPNKDSKASPR